MFLSCILFYMQSNIRKVEHMIQERDDERKITSPIQRYFKNGRLRREVHYKCQDLSV